MWTTFPPPEHRFIAREHGSDGKKKDEATTSPFIAPASDGEAIQTPPLTEPDSEALAAELCNDIGSCEGNMKILVSHLSLNLN